MTVYFALSTPDPATHEYEVFGKGEDAASAEAEGRLNLPDGEADEALGRNFTVLERVEAESQGLIPRNAAVIWYAHLGRYRAEVHDATVAGKKPTGVTSR